MEKDKKTKVFGLLGRQIDYSFSKSFFTKKFKEDTIQGVSYLNFDIGNINDFKIILKQNKNIKGLNVTIPYKEAVIPFLDSVEKEAKQIGAVNTIKITKEGLKGYNTDCYGFENSISPLLKKNHEAALILGKGGASKAVAHIFKKKSITYKYVSRTPSVNDLSYDILKDVISNYQIIINCTPLGTFPDVKKTPNIPYDLLSENYLLYDLIYNPSETMFLKKGKLKGAIIKNGKEMLELQALKSWEIWNSE